MNYSDEIMVAALDFLGRKCWKEGCSLKISSGVKSVLFVNIILQLDF